jgi:hypothetical protein
MNVLKLKELLLQCDDSALVRLEISPCVYYVKHLTKSNAYLDSISEMNENTKTYPVVTIVAEPWKRDFFTLPKIIKYITDNGLEEETLKALEGSKTSN